MRCPACETENSDDARFCSNCGLLISVECNRCGTINKADSQYCTNCGKILIDQNTQKNQNFTVDKSQLIPKITTSSIETDIVERRMVTILFADIVSYSTFSERMDPEYLVDIMREIYPCLLDPIQDHNGTVVQVMGDGVLAYFGTPFAKEDDPERAIIAGLEIVAGIKTYTTSLKIANNTESIYVRAGINTGLVVVGEMHPDKHLEYVALGDAVNFAARMMQNAPPNCVLISQATYQHVPGLFDVLPQPPILVKGRQEHVKTYLVQKRKAFKDRKHKRGIEGRQSPMLGREPEMAALQNYYQDAILGGETSLVLITGDPGIGKTRLVYEYSDWALTQPDSPYLLRGRAITSTQDVAYGVLRNLFAKKFEILETDSSSSAMVKFRQGMQEYLDPEQADLVGQLVGFDFLRSPAVKKLYGSASFSEIANLYLMKYFRNLAETSLLLVLEDLHWMDDSSLDLICELVTKLGGEKNSYAMVVCTARDEFFERRENWGEGITGFRHLHLKQLSRLRSQSLITNLLVPVTDVPDIFLDFIIDEAEGNPFFIEELIKMLIEIGVVDTSSEAWKINAGKLAAFHIPDTLTGVLQARLDSLPSGEKLVLQRAAVIGRTFWDGILHQMSEEKVEKQRLNHWLESLRERGLIYKLERSSLEGHQEFLFKHAMVHDAAYETVLIKMRRRYHIQVAEWVKENAGERLDEHLSLIADHYAKGDQPYLAAQWTIRAAERSAKQYVMHEARKLFEKALQLLPEDDSEHRWLALKGHSEAVGFLGERESRKEDDIALLGLAQKMEDESRIAEAYFLIGTQAHYEGNNQEALHAFDNALLATQGSGDKSLQAEILPMKIAVLTVEGELESAALLIDQALKLAEESGDKNILARALANVSYYYQVIGNISNSVALMHRQIDINREQGDRVWETIGQINLGYFYLTWGQYLKGQGLLTQALETAQTLEARRLIAYCLLNLGLAGWRLKQLKDAFGSLALSLPKLEALNDQRGLASHAFYLGLVYEESGDLICAKEQYAKSAEAFDSLGATTQMIEAKTGLARVAEKQDIITEAVKITREITHYLDQEGSQGFEFPILVYLTCAKVLKKGGYDQLFKSILKEGYELLQKFLEQISDDQWRQVFLEDVSEIATLIRLIEDER